MEYGKLWIGGTEYIKNIIRALRELPEDVRSTFEISLICGNSVDPVLYSEVSPYLKTITHINIENQPRTLVGNYLKKLAMKLGGRENWRFKKFLRSTTIDCVYPYFDATSSTYRAIPWIYDFQHKYLSELFSEKEINQRDRMFTNIADSGSIVVVSSQAAADDFRKFYPRSTTSVQVLPFKIYPDPSWYEESPQKVQQEYSLPDKFFIVCNQFWVHKNHQVIFEALRLLREQNVYPNVVCTGEMYDFRRPEYRGFILELINKYGITSQVFLLGLVPRFQQVQLMRRSLAILQPSLFEGWSTVVEEARVLAKPIVLSSIPVHLEQNPPECYFFDGYNPEGMASIMKDLWEKLQPGPFLDLETKRRMVAINELRDFGYRFLKIARGDYD